MDNIILWVWFHIRVHLSRGKQHKLLEAFGNIESIYKANLSDFLELDFLNQEDINRLLDKDLTQSTKDYESMQKDNIRVVACDSEFYPQMLKTVSDYPTVLYMRGKIIDLNKRFCIAMVGTRKATNYGKICANNLARDLSLAGAVVVSGMAMGIDTFSHEGALKGSSPTVAVIGCGVDMAYPRQNAGLMKRIMENGMIISEYPPGTNAEKYHFPERNRIISGICHGTVVVEADFKSGSLITARCAAEQGRDVFAVPGDINSTYSKGSNYLLKDGARVVTNVEDILSYYRYDYPHLFRIQEEKKENSNISCHEGSFEERILCAMQDTSVHLDKICELTGLDAGCVNASLLMMELSGKVLKLPGGFYSKTV